MNLINNHQAFSMSRLRGTRHGSRKWGGGSGAVHFGFRFGVALVGGAVRFAVAALAAIGRAQVIRR